jgi:hypothetical protein
MSSRDDERRKLLGNIVHTLQAPQDKSCISYSSTILQYALFHLPLCAYRQKSHVHRTYNSMTGAHHLTRVVVFVVQILTCSTVASLEFIAPRTLFFVR